MAIDPRALEPGTVVVHITGTVHVLRQRKDDGSGWWLTDHSGLWDGAWLSGAWKVITEESLLQIWTLLDDNGHIMSLPTEEPADDSEADG